MENKVVYVCNALLEHARNKYPELGSSDSQNDSHLTHLIPELFEIVEAAVLQLGTLEVEEMLDIDDYFDNEFDEASEEDQQEATESVSQDWESEDIDGEIFTLENMKKIVAFYDSARKNKWKQTTRRYPRLTHKSSIKRFRKYIAQNGKKLEKFKVLEDHVFQQFCEARERRCYVSEKDLQRWGYIKANELDLNFSGSASWLYNFKRKHRIVSRKVTKFVTLKDVLEQPNLRETADLFVQNFKEESLEIDSKLIFNFDQSGFNYEKTSDRTLSFKGEKDTLAAVQSKNKISHSYTIMPLLSMSGRLSPKLLLCLQEKDKQFGPIVYENLNIPSNIYLVCSKSGKLDTDIMTQWVYKYVSPLVDGSNFILLHDSWTCQCKDVVYGTVENCRRFQIPPKVTSMIQPLDIYIFRQYKIIHRKLSDRLRFKHPEVLLGDRQNVIKMHSLVYNQLQSPKFYPMLQYAWYAGGYTENRGGYFKNANEILFDSKNIECDEFECKDEFFLTCGHCDENLCLRHFFKRNHFHEMRKE